MKARPFDITMLSKLRPGTGYALAREFGYADAVGSHAVLHAQGWDMEGDYSASCPVCRREGSGQ